MEQSIEYGITFNENINVLGICGREGAGKTTIANILTNQIGPQYELRLINSPLDYICDVIFGTLTDNIWTLTREQQLAWMESFIHSYVDREWMNTYGKKQMFAPFDIINDNNDNWIEFSMATPLKKVCSVIFQIPYEVLLAQTPADRILRETIVTKVNGNTINGRVALEYFGTDIMRNLFDKDIWLKIMQRDAAVVIASNRKVVIPDIRFENEMNLVNKLGGTLLVVCRNTNELVLTEADIKTHPAKWNFINFYKNAKKYYVFLNIWPLDVLPSQIKQMFNCALTE